MSNCSSTSVCETLRCGYGVGVIGDAGAFLRSVDGGQHWQRIAALPVATSASAPAGAALSFVDTLSGWVVAGNGWLLATADGGAHWRHVAVPSARSVDNRAGLLSAVAFVDRWRGCVEPAGYRSVHQGTSDGGAHWRAVPGYTSVGACGKRARHAGKWVGSGMGVDVDYAIRMARRGVQWLQVGGDYRYLVTLVDRTAQTLRAAISS